MINFILILFHVLACLFLIIFVLLQAGKSADLAGAFGGGGSQTAFGGRTAGNFLTRMTTVMAIVFMVTCLVLSLRYNTSYSGGSSAIPLQDTKPAAATTPAPAGKPDTPTAAPAATANPSAGQDSQPAGTSPQTPVPATNQAPAK